MTKQQNTHPETPPGFGDIPINREPQTLAGKPARSRRQPPRPTQHKSPALLLLLLSLAAAALYFAAILLLVPMLVKGPVAANLGHRLNRPVQISKVSLSPFNLRLHLAGISIGPDQGRKGDDPLGTIADIEGRLLPGSLLQGKVALADVRITRLKANLIHSADSSLLQLLQSSAENSSGTVLPSWLLVQGLELSDSTLNILDQPNSRQYTVEQIHLNLPAAGPETKGSKPTLEAMINESPVTLQGRSLENADGSTETRLHLQFPNIDLQQAVSFLPDNLPPLNVGSDKTKTDLKIIFKNTASAGMQLIVTGTVNATNLTIQTPDNTFSLTVPTMQMLFKARPLANRYTITSLTAVAPELTLAGTQPDWPTSVQIAFSKFVDSSIVGLGVDLLKIDQATLIRAEDNRRYALQLQLTNLRNTTARKPEQPAALNLQVQTADSTVAFQGKLSSDHTLAGRLSLHNMEAKQLQAFLPENITGRFGRGLLQLEGTLRTQLGTPNRQSWKITESSLRVSNFSLQKQDSPWAVGKELRGTNCRLQSSRSGINCQQISFSRTDFFPAGFVLFSPTESNSTRPSRFLSFDTLDVNNSTAELALLPQLSMTDIQLHLSGMQQTNPGPENLRMKARLGVQGKVGIRGIFKHNGQGVLQVSAANIELNRLPSALFSHWLAPKVHQGTVQLDGRLKIPDLRFAGSLQINDFLAGPDNTPVLRWQKAALSDLTAQLAPFSAVAGRLVLEQPAISLAQGKGTLPQDLLTLLKQNNEGPILPRLMIKDCIINSGSLSAAGGTAEQFNLTDIEGTIQPLQKNTPAEFTLSGRINGANWTASGRTGLQDSDQQRLQITGFRFPPTVQTLFADTLQLDASRATADLTVSSTEPGILQLTGCTPLPGSDLALLLALLTEQNNTFSLQLPALANTDPSEILSQTVPPLLARLRLQAAVSPGLILQSRLPELNLLGTVEFLPGQTIPDFMDGLEDYAALLSQRPYLALAVRGNFDDIADRLELLQVLQEEADAQLELENIRREQRKAQLLNKQQELANRQNPPPGSRLRLQEQLAGLQPLPQTTVQLPPDALANLARQRAEVLCRYLINTLHIPEIKIQHLPVAAGGSKAELVLLPNWPTVP